LKEATMDIASECNRSIRFEGNYMMRSYMDIIIDVQCPGARRSDRCQSVRNSREKDIEGGLDRCPRVI
jgi:hypothetical protein